MAKKRRKWTEDEIRFLKDHYLIIRSKKCAEALSRSIHSVYHQAGKMGLKVDPHYTKYEVDYIKTHYASKGPLKLANEMKRSSSAVRDMAVRLGLSVSHEARKVIAKQNRAGWTEESHLKKSKSQKKYKGSLSPSWKGGICNVSEIIRGRLLSAWVKYVFQRDDYTCQLCGNRGGKLTVHHVRTFAEIRDTVMKEHPDLDIEKYEDRDNLSDLVIEAHTLDDGITLCRDCHKKHHLANGVNCGNILPGGAGDNPQPSQSKVVSIVDWKVQRLTAEDTTTNKADTSAPLSLSQG